MMDASKYRVGYFPVGKEYSKWTEKDHIEKPPVWCSVDMRDGKDVSEFSEQIVLVGEFVAVAAVISEADGGMTLELFHRCVEMLDIDRVFEAEKEAVFKRAIRHLRQT